jgi:hypothetical protein
MKGIIIAFLVVAIVLGLEAITESESTVSVTPAVAPQREPYVAPVWVTNEQGQRCIKQSDVVTCG